MTKIALLNIGSELLTGRTINTNAATIALQLRAKGYHLESTAVCHDTWDEITFWLSSLLDRHEVVLITGGLGPTKDDITKKVLLDHFGGEMTVHEPTLRRIESYLSMRNRRLLESNRLQSFVPSSCTVIDNFNGTAPGMAFERDGKIVVSMPGVPLEMQYLMQDGVLPLLQSRYPSLRMLTRMVRTAGIPESRIAERMEEIEADLPEGLQVAYLPGYDGTKIELRLKADRQAAPEKAIAEGQRRIADLFSKYTYALVDKNPDTLLAELLLARQITMATAESCTGGAIAAKMVEHSGMSAVFKGGVVAYMRETKEKILGVPPATIDEFGIVSGEVAKAMAKGARERLGTDFAVSITGIAEAPADAPPAELPQAWIGYADANGEQAIHIKLFRQRKQNIEVAANAVLIYALRILQRK